ncbi:hypothetical protein GCM10007981_19200 [Thermocladium modestius]|uniref:Uncharacterized protein n=1 Tax=Thermocladium modestius TaxID=62609 RepID=A0A830GWY9_9CREN|nr:hypothetical protein [Thermocladium modestius]GGP22577.1 hypothetical protein GCM10007981_19200 [Thermocladium modestius]
MFFGWFKKFSQASNSSEYITPASYKERKLYVGDEYRGIIRNVRYKKKTGKVVGFIIINKEGVEENIDVNGKLIIRGDSVVLSAANTVNGGDYEAAKEAPGKASIEAVMNQLDHYVKEISEYDEKIIKAIEVIISDPNNHEKETTVYRYINEFQRKKEEAVVKCKEALSLLTDEIDRLTKELNSKETEARDLELKQQIGYGLSNDYRQRLNELTSSIRNLKEKLTKLYLKQKEYESKCRD